MRYLVLLTLLIPLSGCAFLGGMAVGALGTGAAYEINANSELNKLEEDYQRGRISRRVYEERKKQIQSGSVIY